jgi:hypothetical protein
MSLDDPTNEDRPPQLPNSYRKLKQLCVSQAPPLGTPNVSTSMAKAVSVSGANLVFEVTVASQLIATIAGR